MVDKIGEDMKNNKDTNDVRYLPIGMCIGIGVGMAIGAGMGNIPIGMSIGLSVGVCIGAVIDFRNDKKSDDE